MKIKVVHWKSEVKVFPKTQDKREKKRKYMNEILSDTNDISRNLNIFPIDIRKVEKRNNRGYLLSNIVK